MVEVAVTIVCGVDAQRFSTKMIFSTSVGSKGGWKSCSSLGTKQPRQRENTIYKGL